MKPARFIVVLLVASITFGQLMLSAAGATRAVTVHAHGYPVGHATFPDVIAVDSKRGFVYTGLFQTGEVAVLNTKTGAVLDVPLHGEATGIAVDHTSGRAYVVDGKAADEGVPSPAFVDIVRGTHKVATIPLGTVIPAGAVFDARNNSLYVAETSTNRVAIITGTHYARSVVVGAGPTQLALNPKTDNVYVSDSAGSSVSVLRGKRVVATVHVPSGPAGLAVDAKTNQTYAACTSDRVAILTGTRRTATLKMPKGSEPTSVAVSVATHTAFIGEPGTYVDGGDEDLYPGSGYAVIHGSQVIARHTLSEDVTVTAVTALPGTGEALISQYYGKSRLIDRHGHLLAKTPYLGGGPGQAVSPHLLWTTDGASNLERVDISG